MIYTTDQAQLLLEVYRELFELEGDRTLILEGVQLCAKAGVPLPFWLAAAFLRAYADTRHRHRHKSWDDVFGAPHAKGTHLGADRRRHTLGRDAYVLVGRIKTQNPDTPIDEALFDRVGRALGASRTVTAEAYYRMKKFLKGDIE